MSSRRLGLPGKLAAATGLGAWSAALSRGLYGVDRRGDTVHHPIAADGWRLALHRYQAASGPRRTHPVLLCPGLAANRTGFDLAPERSLARRLAALGWDTWCIELRGHGLSERPVPFGKRSYGWSFDDYLRLDAPAALSAVLEASGAEQVHWIGHSMGGVLLLALLATGGAERLRSGLTIGSAIDYTGSGSDFEPLCRWVGVTRVLPMIPLGPLALLTAPLAGRVPNRLEEFNAWPSNVEPELVRRLNASAFHPVSSPVLAQLSSMFLPGGLRSADGMLRYKDGLARATTPVLFLAGDRDRQCPPAAVQATATLLGERGRVASFGREHGQPDHYGHFDLIIGRRAPSETWPVIEGWLEEQDQG